MDPKGSLPHSHVPAPVPILSQLHSVHTPTSHFLRIQLNIILPSTPRSPKWSLSLRFPHQTPVYAIPLPHTRYMSCPFHSSRFNHPKNIGEDFRSLSSSLYSFLNSRVTSSLLGPNILLNTLFSDILSVSSFLNVKQDLVQKYFLPFKQWQRRQYNVKQ